MALQGSLEDFSLAEILQLIALQKKSGVLRLTSPEASAVLFFERGVVVSLTDRRERKSDPLLEYLHGTNRLTTEQVEQIYAIRAQSKKEFAEVIITGGYLTSKQLAQAVELHARELLPKLLSWKKGVYHFSGDEKTVARLYFKVPMRTEALLMESMRRIDESDRIKQLYSPAAVLRRREPTEKLELADEEKWVLGLIDGSRPIREILGKSRLGEFETYEILSDLIQAGAAEVAQWTSDGEPEAEPAVPVRKTSGLAPILGIGVAVILIAGASFGIRWVLKTLGEGPAVSRATATLRVEASREENIRFAAEVFRAAQGSYPEELSELVARGLLADRDIEGFSYSRLSDGFELHRRQGPQSRVSP
ncbi:MAG: DUF4388 domain-containing protein [Candidatus Eiseniibacteriota bacterium]|nr:MAG: DUF4388 domain-containing protein [Candidatus Eisenbacteria bacterium]